MQAPAHLVCLQAYEDDAVVVADPVGGKLAVLVRAAGQHKRTVRLASPGVRIDRSRACAAMLDGRDLVQAVKDRQAQPRVDELARNHGRDGRMHDRQLLGQPVGKRCVWVLAAPALPVSQRKQLGDARVGLVTSVDVLDERQCRDRLAVAWITEDHQPSGRRLPAAGDLRPRQQTPADPHAWPARVMVDARDLCVDRIALADHLRQLATIVDAQLRDRI